VIAIREGLGVPFDVIEDCGNDIDGVLFFFGSFVQVGNYAFHFRMDPYACTAMLSSTEASPGLFMKAKQVLLLEYREGFVPGPCRRHLLPRLRTDP